MKSLTGLPKAKGFLLKKLREIDYECGYRIERFQFPVSIGYALTINKSQGQTFNQIGLELQTPVFSHGQLYVALSRVRSFNNLKIRVLYPRTRQKNKCSGNIFKEYSIHGNFGNFYFNYNTLFDYYYKTNLNNFF